MGLIAAGAATCDRGIGGAPVVHGGEVEWYRCTTSDDVWSERGRLSQAQQAGSGIRNTAGADVLSSTQRRWRRVRMPSNAGRMAWMRRSELWASAVDGAHD